MAESPVQIRSTDAAVRDHSRQYADFVFVYPVISRRSRGLSLGVNLNPDKICNFDCIYCEVDRRTPGRASQVDLPNLRRELVALIRLVQDGGLDQDPRFAAWPAAVTRDIRDIAFSGDGEPTMIPNFAACVEAVAEIKRAAGLNAAKLVLITNAAGLDKADVKRGLALLDANQGEIWGKLDAGTEPYFRRVNRTAIRFDRILANLRETARSRPIVIQSLFLKVHGELIPAAELAAYCDRLKELVRDGAQLREVHAYTVARPTPEVFATRLTKAELESVAAVIRTRTGLPVLSFE
jgi:wyosine [tRNA(Phe)-imidazoG37] synthetase (radical SAM superfamily)